MKTVLIYSNIKLKYQILIFKFVSRPRTHWTSVESLGKTKGDTDLCVTSQHKFSFPAP